jgi:uncharacterized protein (DUF111 family)
MGMAGDMFAAALLGLRVSPSDLIGVMEFAAEGIGGATVTVKSEPLAGGIHAYHLESRLHCDHGSISFRKAFAVLERTIEHTQIREPYAGFALRALTVLAKAEGEAHRLLAAQAVGEDDRAMPRTPMDPPVDAPQIHGHGEHLHEAQDIIMDVAAASWGLQYLSVDLANVRSTEPIMTGSGTVRFSHGSLPVPAPATRAILERFSLPWSPGPMDFEQLTPTGAAILAALEPAFLARKEIDSVPGLRGHGLGTKRSDPPNLLTLILRRDGEETAGTA